MHDEAGDDAAEGRTQVERIAAGDGYRLGIGEGFSHLVGCIGGRCRAAKGNGSFTVVAQYDHGVGAEGKGEFKAAESGVCGDVSAKLGGVEGFGSVAVVEGQGDGFDTCVVGDGGGFCGWEVLLGDGEIVDMDGNRCQAELTVFED